MPFENFGLMMPTHAVYDINNCHVFNLTGAQFELFKKWVDSGEIMQLKTDNETLDYWINKDPHGLGRTIKRLNEWADYFINPPKKTYGSQSFEIKL